MYLLKLGHLKLISWPQTKFTPGVSLLFARIVAKIPHRSVGTGVVLVCVRASHIQNYLTAFLE
jgi:hypothetical protein